MALLDIGVNDCTLSDFFDRLLQVCVFECFQNLFRQNGSELLLQPLIDALLDLILDLLKIR